MLQNFHNYEYEPIESILAVLKNIFFSFLEVWFLLDINPVAHVQKLTPNLLRIISKYTNFEVQHNILENVRNDVVER